MAICSHTLYLKCERIRQNETISSKKVTYYRKPKRTTDLLVCSIFEKIKTGKSQLGTSLKAQKEQFLKICYGFFQAKENLKNTRVVPKINKVSL